MVYTSPVVSIAAFHALNVSMFHLARGYAQAGMKGYAKLQQEEFAAQELGYRAVTHQRFVGTGYFDEIAQVVSSRNSSPAARAGSQETDQFHGATLHESSNIPAADAHAGGQDETALAAPAGVAEE